MIDLMYLIFRQYGMEGAIQCGLISYALFILCGSKQNEITGKVYVGITVLSYLVIFTMGTVILPEEYMTILMTHVMPYWFHFLLLIGLEFLLSGLLLANSFFIKSLYTLFLAAFINLYKVVCSPVYQLESQVEPRVYQILDVISMLVGILLLILLIMLFKKLRIETTINIKVRKIWFAMYFPLSILLVYILVSNNRVLNQYSDVASAFLLMTFIPLAYYVIWIILKSNEEQKRLDRALTENKTHLAKYRFSTELQLRLKKERHELKNNYFYIQTLLKEKQYEKLDQYMENVIGEKLSDLNEVETGNTLMDYLLNRKVGQARKRQIKTYVEVIVPAHMNVSEDLLCTILLNLLDNAIEASEKMETPDIHINISCVNSYLVCIIKNRASETQLNENLQLRTTKKDAENHGLGLKIVRSAVRQANGIFHIDRQDGYFVAKVMLPIE